MDELSLSCDLELSFNIEIQMKEFIKKSELKNSEYDESGVPSYGGFLSIIKDFLIYHYTGPDYIHLLMLDIINKINTRPDNDYLIKHAVYIIKININADLLFLFLHVIEKLINERRLRLL